MLTIEQQKLVEDNLALARNFVRTQAFLRPLRRRLRCQWSDMYSIANLALCQAAERFNPATGNSFSTFFYATCRGLFLVELRTTRNHRNSIMYNSISYDKPAYDDAEHMDIDFMPDDSCEYESFIDLCQTIESALNSSERECISLHHLQGYPLEEVARIVGSTRGAVSVRLSRARQKLVSFL